METIRSSREIDRVFSAGKRRQDPLVVVIVAPTQLERGPSGRVAFIAGKKLGGAVIRNRAKRVLRTAAREAGAPWMGYDVLLIARPALLKASSASVAAAIGRITSAIGSRR